MILFDNCLQIYKLTRRKIINNMLQMTFNFFLSLPLSYTLGELVVCYIV